MREMYGGRSPAAAASRDLNLSFPASPFRQQQQQAGKEESSDPNRGHSHQHHHHHHHQNQQQQQQMGLQRYRSAPSSLLLGEEEEVVEVEVDFLNPHHHHHHHHHHKRSSNPPEEEEEEATTSSSALAMFARFMPPGEKPHAAGVAAAHQRSPHFMPPPGAATDSSSSAANQQQQMLYHQHQQIPSHSSAAAAMESSSYGGVVVSSMAMEANNCPTPNLLRQSSSPAGLFSSSSHLHADHGYGVLRGIGGGGFNRAGSNEDPAAAAMGGISRLKGQLSFSSSRQGSGGSPAAGLMSQISDQLGSEGIDGGGGSSSSPDQEDNSTSNGGGRCYNISAYPVASWDDPSLLSDSLSSGLINKRGGSRDFVVNPSEAQNGDVRNHHVLGLSHQFSFPKTSSEMAAVEKFLQFQDAVPNYKIRAKRGCATHPRSIAERVRRTRISERMRKLQELVPNMEKQTNTADMLDLAVDYIKDLQIQVKNLSDSRANCTCSSKLKTYPSPAV